MYQINTIVRNIINGTFLTRTYQQTIELWLSLSEAFVFPIQRILLHRVLSNARNKVAYYKEQRLATNDISIFPIVDKYFITSQKGKFISCNKEKYTYWNVKTGGSTGEPFELLASGGYEREFGKKRWKAYGYQSGETILAMDGTALDNTLTESGIYWKKKNEQDVPFGSWALSSLYLTEANSRRYCEYIVDLAPDYIRGYPSFVYAIACYFEKFNITCNTNIKAIELTSETALPYQIDKIKKVFNAKVFLQYGHTESCICAYTYDETYRYRVEPLYGYVEILDEKGQHVKEGEIGEVVVTTLHNHVMPLIRYRTGDFAEYGGKDKRYTYINRVMGRTQDYIYDSNGNKVLLTALIFAQHFDALSKITKWQLEQDRLGIVTAHIIKGSDYTENDEKEIYTLFMKLANIKVIFDYTDSIAVTKRGKSKMLVQHIQL